MYRRVFVNMLMWQLVVGRTPPLPFKPHRDVVTTQGVVRGYLTHRPPHYAYLGLPYGRPTHYDRFKATKPPPHWDGIFEATYRVKCPQVNGDEEDENCLVVNVFTPKQGTALPVVVIVHDGDFHSGWGAFQPPSRLIKQEFIVVTFNYRLGALGFLCLGTPAASGNVGLKDQVAALYWIHRNIASFGGNPLEITVYGIGSGAMSVEILLLSGLPKGLIHKVILESGSILSPSTFIYEPIASAFYAALSISYNGTKNNKDLVNFYRKVSVKELNKISNKFSPCIENESSVSGLLVKDAWETLKQGKYHQIPMLFTYRNSISITPTEAEKLKVLPDNFEDLLPNNLEFGDEKTKYNVAKSIKEFYFDGIDEHDSKEELVTIYMNYISDILNVYPAIKLATLFASRSVLPVYLMEFSYKDGINKLMQNYSMTYADVFHYISSSKQAEYNEELMVQRLMTLYRNFIKLGDPTPLITSLLPLIWQPLAKGSSLDPVRTSSIPCLHIGTTLSMDECSLTQSLAIWDRVYKMFYKPYYSVGIRDVK